MERYEIIKETPRTNNRLKTPENGEYSKNKWLKNYEYNYYNIDCIKDSLIKLFE